MRTVTMKVISGGKRKKGRRKKKGSRKTTRCFTTRTGKRVCIKAKRKRSRRKGRRS